MRKIVLVIALSGIIIGTNTFAKCDPDNARNSSVIPVWNSNTGRNTGEYHFYFSRDCDKTDYSCSYSANLLINADGKSENHAMRWIVEPITNSSSWYVEKFVHGKNLSYIIQYQDESGNSCVTIPKHFS